jgi:branched-chain amino acid transport system substrate-binding protein
VKKLMRMFAVTVAALAIPATMTVPAQAQEKVKIGVIGHFSGPFAAAGKQYREGIEAFVAANGDTSGGRQIDSFIATSAAPTPPLPSRRCRNSSCATR